MTMIATQEKTRLGFRPAKAVEIVLYLANRVPNPTILSICKLMYLSDKTHLERLGRFLCGERYVAMKYGPVPSYIYDILKSKADDPEEDSDGLRVTERRNVRVLRGADNKRISPSAKKTLDIVIKQYGNLPIWDLLNKCHDKAWLQAWNNRGEKNSVDIPVDSILALLEDSDELLSHLHGDG